MRCARGASRHTWTQRISRSASRGQIKHAKQPFCITCRAPATQQCTTKVGKRMGLNGMYAGCIVRLIEHTMELCRLSQAVERQQLTSPLKNGRLRKGGATDSVNRRLAQDVAGARRNGAACRPDGSFSPQNSLVDVTNKLSRCAVPT